MTRASRGDHDKSRKPIQLRAMTASPMRVAPTIARMHEMSMRRTQVHHAEREALPVTSDEKKGRCRLHRGAKGSGGSPGKRNGQYRHGERTKAVIAEQRKFSTLLKMVRAGLS